MKAIINGQEVELSSFTVIGEDMHALGEFRNAVETGSHRLNGCRMVGWSPLEMWQKATRRLYQAHFEDMAAVIKLGEVPVNLSAIISLRDDPYMEARQETTMPFFSCEVVGANANSIDGSGAWVAVHLLDEHSKFIQGGWIPAGDLENLKKSKISST